MKMHVDTKFSPYLIEQGVIQTDDNGSRYTIWKTVMMLQDQELRKALIALVWTPPNDS